jgi:hypothetical protein
MNLYQFIKKLSPEEAKLVRKQFKLNQKSNENQFAQESSLFERILESGETTIDDDYFLGGVFSNLNDSAFSKIKSKLFYKILDAFSGDAFLMRDDLIEPHERINMQVKKKLLQLKTLRFKMNTAPFDVIQHLLNEVIETSREYEMYDSLVEALTFKKRLIQIRSNYKEFEKINHEISYFQECSNILQTASDAFNTIVSNQNLISHFTEEEMNTYIETKIRELEANAYTTVSIYVQYYYKILKLVQYERKKMYSECIDVCLDVLNMLNRSKAISRKERFGFVYDNLGQYWLLQRNFSGAIDSFRSAQKNYVTKSFAYMISKEQEFYASFYGKQYGECQKILEILLAHDKRDSGEIRYDKFLYYASCLDFVTGKFKEALRISNLGLQITRDKSRWEIGMRYIKILCLIEMEDYHEAGQAIDSLRKQIKRLNSSGQLEKRDSIIYKSLRQYEKEGFGKVASPRLSYLMKRLSKKNVPWSWKFYSHELIPVQQWLKKRVVSHFTAKPLVYIKKDNEQEDSKF